VTKNQRISLLLASVAALLFAFGGSGGLAGIVPGPRVVVVLHETAEVTSELQQQLTLLQTGANAEYCKAKGHKMRILDDDAKGVDRQPLPLVTRLAAENIPLPSAFVLNGDAILARDHIDSPSNAATEVMDLLKGAGG
jgi:hypothetical protein